MWKPNGDGAQRTNNNVNVNTLPSGSVNPHDSERPQYAAAKSSWSRFMCPTGRYSLSLSLFPSCPSFRPVSLSSSFPPSFSFSSCVSSSSSPSFCSAREMRGMSIVLTSLYVGIPDRLPGSAIQNMTCFFSWTCSRHSSIASVFQPQMTRCAWRRSRSWGDSKSIGMRRAPGGGGLGAVCAVIAGIDVLTCCGRGGRCEAVSLNFEGMRSRA